MAPLIYIYILLFFFPVENWDAGMPFFQRVKEKSPILGKPLSDTRT